MSHRLVFEPPTPRQSLTGGALPDGFVARQHCSCHYVAACETDARERPCELARAAENPSATRGFELEYEAHDPVSLRRLQGHNPAPGGDVRLAALALVNWKKVAEALFSDSSSFAAGKRRDFCRLPHAQLFRNQSDKLLVG